MSESFQTYLSQHIQLDIEEFCDHLSFNNVIADLFISNKCNLKCRHCYFGDTINIDKALSQNEWIDAIDKLYLLGVRHFHFSGKESSLCEMTIFLMSYIKTLHQTYAGLVSNGLGNINYYVQLLQMDADYLEFSIDGLKENHNFIRGGEFFNKTFACVKSLKDQVDKINITTCLNKRNYNEYINLILMFYNLGVTRFFATPYLLKGRASGLSSMSIAVEEYALLIQSIITFLQQMPDAKLRVRFCIPIEYTYESFECNRFLKQIIIEYFEEGKDSIFRVNDNVLQLSFLYMDIDYVNTITISNDGYIIPCADDISNNEYYLCSLGNIRTTDAETLKKARKQIINKQSLSYFQKS